MTTKTVGFFCFCFFQNEIYWDDWSQLSIFRASKYTGSQMEILASQLTGLMDMKIFYKGKNTGKVEPLARCLPS